MRYRLPAAFLRVRDFGFALLGASLCLSQLLTAQVPFDSKEKPSVIKFFEDDEVRIPIPAGWTRGTGSHPALQATKGWGNSVSQARRKLLLQKDGYVLALAYETDHASGIKGGRFLEAFHIPWLDRDASEQCSFIIVPQPASRVLLFENLTLDSGNPKARASCGLKNVISENIAIQGVSMPESITEKWFASYFTSGSGGVFFDEREPYNENGCHSKVFSLTSTAKTFSELPNPYAPALHEIIQEAIDIVSAIHYKRCAPRVNSPLER